MTTKKSSANRNGRAAKAPYRRANNRAAQRRQANPPPPPFVTRIRIDTSGKQPDDTSVDFVFLYSPEIVGGDYVGRCEQPHDCVLRFRFSPDQALPETLIVRHRDGRPDLQKIIWCPSQPAPDWNSVPRRRQRYEARRQLIDDHLEGPPHDHAAKMCEFDKRTDPYALASRNAGMARDILDLTRFLSYRTMQRASCAVHGVEFSPIHWEDAAQKELALSVEQYVRTVLLEVFRGERPALMRGQGRPPSLDVRSFEATMAAFVAGELQMALIAAAPVPMALDGVPDGPNLFAFAEAALLFIKFDLNSRFWQRLLPVFVCAAEFFVTCYWSRKGRQLGSYHPRYLPAPGQRVSSAEILLHLQERYRALTPSQLAAALTGLLGLALSTDPAISLPTYVAKELRCN